MEFNTSISHRTCNTCIYGTINGKLCVYNNTTKSICMKHCFCNVCICGNTIRKSTKEHCICDVCETLNINNKLKKLKKLLPYCTCDVCTSSIFSPLHYWGCIFCHGCLKAGPLHANKQHIKNAIQLKNAYRNLPKIEPKIVIQSFILLFFFIVKVYILCS